MTVRVDTARSQLARLGRLTDVVYAVALVLVIDWLPMPEESLEPVEGRAAGGTRHPSLRLRWRAVLEPRLAGLLPHRRTAQAAWSERAMTLLEHALPSAGRRLPCQRLARRLVLVSVALFSLAPLASAQEFEPRTYSLSPSGLNFLAFGTGFSTGAVFMDPALPVEDVDAEIHLLFARYVRSFSLAGRPAKLKVLLPWTDGHWDGFVEGEFRTRDTRGIGDARFVLETLFGARAVPVGEPVEQPKTLWGARLQVITPTGEYDNTKVINLGSNRWTFVPELGLSHSFGKNDRWSVEAALNAWLFTDNDDFVGLDLEQDPLHVLKLHFVRSIRPGFWWALAAGFGFGGRTTVDGIRRDTIQRNWRLSASVAYPFTATQGISVSVGSGGNAGAGTDFDAVSLAYQFAW